jgi:photosystem II stability/assembly factor-like uncharacterized protein
MQFPIIFVFYLTTGFYNFKKKSIPYFMLILKKFTTIFYLFILSIASKGQAYDWVKLETEAYKGKQDDIFFINEQQGWYVNGYGKIFHTRNGGNTWEMQLEKKGTFFRCIAFIDSLIGFAGTVGTDYFPNVTDTIPLYKTIDGGKNWMPCPYAGNYVKGLCAIDIVKEQYVNHGGIGFKYHVFAVGRVGSPANLMVSHDGGNTFTIKDMSAFGSMLFDIKMFNKNEGFACSASSDDMEKTHARIIHTNNGGDSWETVYESNRPFEITWKCFFPTKEIGFATIQHYNPDSTASQQRVIKTTNGGNTWDELMLCDDYGARPFGIGFIDENIGFVGTMNSGYKTIDGGKNWSKINLGKACNKIRIQKDGQRKTFGYAIGVNVFKLSSL